VNFTIPQWLARPWRRASDAVNMPFWRRGWVELRYIDIALALGFVVCVVWYYYVAGWPGVALGAAVYIFAAMFSVLARALNE
jgi:uncharacterized membrane protein